jgi:hypothetical protein
MSRHKRDTAAGKPAVTLPGIMTEQDRAIVARREAGETQKAIAASLGIPTSRVQRAEARGHREAEGRALLAECADNIEGLGKVGALSSAARWLIGGHHYYYDNPELARMSDAAKLGRQYWARTFGATAKLMAEVDCALALLGIAWSPVDRTPKPKSPAQPQEAEQPAMSDGSAWSSIVRRVAEIELAVGSAVMESDPHRDSIDRVAYRLAFLTGYLEEHFKKFGARRPMRDITPDDQDDSSEDLETAGNLVCLPGVKLADVLPIDGGAA